MDTTAIGVNLNRAAPAPVSHDFVSGTTNVDLEIATLALGRNDKAKFTRRNPKFGGPSDTSRYSCLPLQLIRHNEGKIAGCSNLYVKTVDRACGKSQGGKQNQHMIVSF